MSASKPALSLPRDLTLSGEPRDRLLARIAFEAIWETDLDTQQMSWIGGLETIFGYDRSEVGASVSWFVDRIHPDDRDRVRSIGDQAIRAGASTWSNEYRFRRKDGSWAWVASRCAIDRDSAGRALRVFGAMMDVSKLKETEARLRFFAEQIPARVGAADRDLRVIWELGTGFPGAGHFTGKTLPEIIQSPDRDRIIEANRKALAGEPGRLEAALGDRFAELRIQPLRDAAGEIIGTVGVALDVTERARAERALRETHRILLEAQRIGQVRAWEEDLRTGTVKVDLATFLGPGELPYPPLPIEDAWKTVHPDDFPRVMEARRRTIETGGPIEADFRMVLPGGVERVLFTRGELVRGADGKPERILGTSLDITDRVRGEEAVRESQRLLRLVLDTLPAGVVVVDKSGNIVLVNPALNRIWGRTIALADERWAKSKGFWHDSGKRIAPTEWASVRALTQGQTSIEELIDIETYDGKQKTMLNSAVPIRDEGGAITGAIIINQDITERARAESELARRARQQAAVARLGLSALRGHDLQALLDEAVSALAAAHEVEFSEVMEIVSDDSLRMRAGFGWRPGVVGMVVPVAGTACGFAIRTQQPAVALDLRKETRFSVHPLLLDHGLVSGVTALIPGRDRPWGTISVHSKEQRIWSQHDIDALQSVANVIAAAIERERAESELREKREQLEGLSRRLIEAQEAERRAVARELHDDFGQVLTAIKLNLMRKERDEAEGLSLVDGAIARMRDLAHDLRPPMLDELGLAASLRWLVEREARRAGLEFHFKMVPPETRMPSAVETTCFRVAQEALTNVIRHAHSRRVDVELRMEGGDLLLLVRDDGRGFDVIEARRRAARGDSQGLLSMQERVALAGGKLEIVSSPGRGTLVRARVPLATATAPRASV